MFPKLCFLKNTFRWGKTYDRGVGSNYLQHAQVKIIENTKCVRYYPHLRSSTVCVVSSSDIRVEAPCNGDSGKYYLRRLI